jgi:uncharacterized protein YjbJ (UPF0337 family)
MSSTPDKISGIADQAVGKVKEAAGKLAGDAKLQAEGAAQQARVRLRRPSATSGAP